MKNYFFATHLTFRPLIRTAPRFKNVLIRLLRRSNILYFPNSSPRRSPACSRTSLTRIIDFFALISFSTHSYSNRNFLLGVFSRTKRFLQTTVHFLKAPNAPVDNKVDTNRYIFWLPEKWLHLHGIFWSEPIPSSKISESKIPASLMHPPQIRES